MVVNEDRFFLSHRKEIAVGAKEKGWDVTIVAKNTGVKDEIEKLGLKYIELPGNPTGKNLKSELKTFSFLYNLYGKNRDAVVHHVGLKNILWGGLAARLRKMRGVVNAVSGLGIIFSEFNPSKLTKILVPVLRWSMASENTTLIFQNKDDRRIFEKNGIGKGRKTYMIKGSGVDFNQYPDKATFESRPKRVVFAARMVKDKGIIDVVSAAEFLRSKYENEVEFWLCGGLSKNPYAVSKEELKEITDGRYIQWLGHRDDMPEILRTSHIMCFPSYYREGIPKAVIDASAAGLPIVTCDTIGCRETVEDGVNGFKVSPKSPQAVAEKLDILLSDDELCKKMGAASREIAERDYDVRKVVATHLKVYDEAFRGL